MERLCKLQNQCCSSLQSDITAKNSRNTFSKTRFGDLVVRRLEIGDYHKGFLNILSQLTQVGDIDIATFEKRFRLQDVSMNGAPSYMVCVIEDTEQSKIVATATLFLEYKYIHDCGIVGHIEDVVVDQTVRGKRLGFRVVSKLIEWGKLCGCYKIILDCSFENISFYEKLGFKQKETQMTLYLNK